MLQRLNILAELLRFGDREFYKDWWNAKTVDEVISLSLHILRLFIYSNFVKWICDIFVFVECVCAAAAAATSIGGCGIWYEASSDLILKTKLIFFYPSICKMICWSHVVMKFLCIDITMPPGMIVYNFLFKKCWFSNYNSVKLTKGTDGIYNFFPYVTFWCSFPAVTV